MQNRVLEIRSLVPPEMWNHCPGKENPADIPSRGASPAELVRSIWFTGPEWVKRRNERTKIISSESELPAEVINEMKGVARSKCSPETSNLVIPSGQPNVSMVIDCEKFSSWNKLIRTTSVVLQFIEKLKRGKENPTTQLPPKDTITQAEQLWITDIQIKSLDRKPKVQVIGTRIWIVHRRQWNR